MNRFLYFLKKSWPFLITLVLWRLSVVFWNPSGVLALIPIFYYTFVKQTGWFVLFAVLFCFLIDYRCNLPLFWTIWFCLFYSINGFQNYMEISNVEKNAFSIFAVFIGLGFLVLAFYSKNFDVFINNVWLFVWLCVLYIPITNIENIFNKRNLAT